MVDVLRRAGVEVVLAGLAGTEAVECSRGVRVHPDEALEGVSGDFAAVVLPGGAGGAEALAADPRIGSILHAQVAKGGWVAAICAAPIALVRHGICGGRRMTSHPGVRDEVASHGQYVEERVVVDGGLLTSRGPGTAFEFALALIRALRGEACAAEVAGPMILPAT